MRLLVLLLALLPSLALAQGPRVVRDLGTVHTGPRVLGEPSFAFELDALSWDEPDRAGWPVTTTRPSACMTYTGSEWVTRGEDEACVDASGLQAFGGWTQYAANSARPDLWPSVGGTPAVSGPDADGWWVYEDAGDGRAKRTVALLAAGTVVSGRYVATLEVRPGTHSEVRPEVVRGGAGTVVYAGGDCDALGVIAITAPGRYHCLIDVSGADATTALRINFEPVINGTGTVLVRQAQLTRTPHPMPRHDCGETPCSRAGERHLVEDISGWPVESGEVRLRYTPLSAEVSENVYLLETRSAFNQPGISIYRHSNGSLIGQVTTGDPAVTYPAFLEGLTWVPCDSSTTSCLSYEVVLRWTPTSVSVERDGALAGASLPAALTAHSAGVAAIGYRYGLQSQAQGWIKLVRVSGGTP